MACRFSVGQLSADCWPTVGRLSLEGGCSSQLPKYQCEWKYRCAKQEMASYITKRRQSFSFSKVVQRYSGDEKVMRWLAPADKTYLVSLGGRSETGAIPVFHRWQEWLQLMRILIFFSFWLKRGIIFCGKLISWDSCSHKGQIHWSLSSSTFAQHLKEESRGSLSHFLVISNNSTRPKKREQTKQIDKKTSYQSNQWQ